MEYNRKQRKELARAHIAVRKEVADNKTIRNLFSMVSVLLGLLLGIIIPGIWLVFSALGVFVALAGVAGAVGAKFLCDHFNYKLYKKFLPNLTRQEYKQLVKDKKFDDCVCELNKSEFKKIEKEVGPKERGYDVVTQWTTEGVREQHENLISGLYKKLRQGKELDAIETEMLNKSINAELFARQTTEKNITYARKQRSLRMSAIKKNGEDLTQEEENAIDLLK